MSSSLQFASFVWTKEEVEGLEWNGRHGCLNWRIYRQAVGEKLAPIINGLFHHKPEFKRLRMEIISLTLRTKKLPAHWGWILAVEYRFAPLEGHWRCVAHFMPETPGSLDGRLYFTPPKYHGK